MSGKKSHPQTSGQDFEPGYLRLHRSGELKRRGEQLWTMMEKCVFCINWQISQGGEGSPRSLDGIVDIYLPDFKYSDGEKASKYSSGADTYPEISRKIIREEYADAVSYARASGLTNLEIQGYRFF